MKRHGPVNLIVHYPTTQEGQEDLARRVAEVHANAVTMRIQQLSCPTSQKQQLLDAVIEDARKIAAKNATAHTAAYKKAKDNKER